ncbi:MAG: hypothetical protein MUE60_10365 [Candidatus Eisenbacteria bacterium]|nr:hypothetical protein [Candidatus Eisenbacteria bacterium]
MRTLRALLLAVFVLSSLVGVLALLIPTPAQALDWCLSHYPSYVVWTDQCCNSNPSRLYACYEPTSDDWCCWPQAQQGLQCYMIECPNE